MFFSDFKKILIGVLVLYFSIESFSQATTRHYIDSVLTISDTSFKEKANVFYVINGVPYDSLQIDTVISRYKTKYLADALFLSREKQSYPFYRDVAVILFAYEQERKAKRKQWKNAKALLIKTDNTNTKLLIDKIPIDPQQSMEMFNSIRLKDIMYIDIHQKDNFKQVRIWKLE
jgi:hypothetical protein